MATPCGRKISIRFHCISNRFVVQVVKFISHEYRDRVADESVEHIPLRKVTLKDDARYTFGRVRKSNTMFGPRN